MKVALISHPACLLHENGPGHPERPQRVRAIDDALIEAGLEPLLTHLAAPRATRAQLERVHDPAYVESIFRRSPAEGRVMLDPDTWMNPHTLEAALRAAGAQIEAVDRIMAGDFRRAFCNVRPPGHHAERDRAMGFCIFNNVAVGTAHAIAAHGLERVAIVDFDVHHGNGTEHIFIHDPKVMYFSTFQHPYYPGVGADTVAENIVNVPLPAGTTGAQYREAVEQHWWPKLEAFAPELIYVSAGFDAHAEDPLAGLLLLKEDYAWVTGRIVEHANRHAQGRVISSLEGGYDLNALGRSAAAHIRALLEVG
ncbi:MAG: histone deacetylase family protein [Gammaproteobacteria bacterium]|nr:MAG: histone deacetylase family protein [Gammaproteobacteria bacterium]